MDAQAMSPEAPTKPAEASGDAAEAAAAGAEAPAGVEIPTEPRSPGFRARGQMRRRVRFLRKARELAYRDLGGLVFEMHRLGQRNDELVAAKLAVLSRFDAELRALEAALGAGHSVTVLREAGIAACPRCAAIHGGGDRFCPACGLQMDRHADRPIVATPAAPQTPAPQPLAPSSPAPQGAASRPPVPQPTAPADSVASPATGTPPSAPAVKQEDQPTEILRRRD